MHLNSVLLLLPSLLLLLSRRLRSAPCWMMCSWLRRRGSSTGVCSARHARRSTASAQPSVAQHTVCGLGVLGVSHTLMCGSAAQGARQRQQAIQGSSVWSHLQGGVCQQGGRPLRAFRTPRQPRQCLLCTGPELPCNNVKAMQWLSVRRCTAHQVESPSAARPT
jgi:hypothetical protein